MQFDGRVALITGAGSGIGQATAWLLAERGAKVVACDLSPEGLEQTAAADPEGRIATLAGDATDAAHAAEAVALAESRFGGLHILVNCVGGSRPGKTILDIDEEEWDGWIRLNLGSAYLFSRTAIPAITRAGGGSIVNIASGAGITGMRRNPAYVAAKGGMIALTKAMAMDHAEAGIRVNAIAPGPILTALMERNRKPEEIAFLNRLSLVGRLGKPLEIATTVAFLASEDGGYVNGEIISVTGGSGGPI